jgi:hypothetical protein
MDHAHLIFYIRYLYRFLVLIYLKLIVYRIVADAVALLYLVQLYWIQLLHSRSILYTHLVLQLIHHQ